MNAFAGLLHRVQTSRYPEGFDFRLPRSTFRFSLVWQHIVTRLRRALVPSWTWAAYKMEHGFSIKTDFAKEKKFGQQHYIKFRAQIVTQFEAYPVSTWIRAAPIRISFITSIELKSENSVTIHLFRVVNRVTGAFKFRQ